MRPPSPHLSRALPRARCLFFVSLSVSLACLALTAGCTGNDCPSAADRAPSTCGLNGRGTPALLCEGSLVTEVCDDPDSCVDGTFEVGTGESCGFNGRGTLYQECVSGQLEPSCQDPDQCESNTIGLSDQICGLNSRGRRVQECFAGVWQVNALSCMDPDVCLDEDVESRRCGDNLRGQRDTRCVEGEWVEGDCEYPPECLSGGSFDPGACPVALPTLTAPSSCPDVSANGRVTIQVAGEAREFLLFLPADPVGKPVAVLWHQLGGSANGFANITNAATLATSLDVIVAIPEMSFRLELGEISVPMWRYLDSTPPGPDLQLFDDILGCLDAEYSVDRARLYAAGASAGGLFSTRLLLDRSEVLAGVAILSGGTDEAHPVLNTNYVTPSAPLPTMVTWGGPTDTLTFVEGFTIDFAQGTEALVDHLVGDGDYVVACDHGQGHSVPAPLIDFALQFLVAQRFGEPNPYASSSPPSMPSDCIVRAPVAP